MEKKQYTRAELVKICEAAFVPQSKWSNRDSASSQISLGSCYALLKAGCEFEVQYTKDKSGCNTDENTIWLQFWVKDFQWFEYGSDSFEDKRGNQTPDYHFYLPTSERLKETKGRDWY